MQLYKGTVTYIFACLPSIEFLWCWRRCTGVDPFRSVLRYRGSGCIQAKLSSSDGDSRSLQGFNEGNEEIGSLWLQLEYVRRLTGSS